MAILNVVRKTWSSVDGFELVLQVAAFNRVLLHFKLLVTLRAQDGVNVNGHVMERAARILHESNDDGGEDGTASALCYPDGGGMQVDERRFNRLVASYLFDREPAHGASSEDRFFQVAFDR